MDDSSKLRGWYDRNAIRYAAMVDAKGVPEQVADFAAGVRGNIILDAGCGTGRDAGTLRRLGLSVVGVDFSSGMLDVARRNGLREVVQADLRALPFGKAQFDGVWANASLHHLNSRSELRDVICEFTRVLRPRGILHVSLRQAPEGNSYDCISVADSTLVGERSYRRSSMVEINDIATEIGICVLKLRSAKEGGSRSQWVVALLQTPDSN